MVRRLFISLLAILPVSAHATLLAPEILPDKVGYLRLPDLSDDTAKRIRPALQDLAKLKPIGTVLDLRGNVGGGINGIHATVESFLPAGTPYMKVFIPNRTLKVTRLQPVLRKSLPLVILMDEKTGNEAIVVMNVLQKIYKATVVAHVTSITSPKRLYEMRSSMKIYAPVQTGAFTVAPDIRVAAETTRLPVDAPDAALQRAAKEVRDRSPWAKK